jgi:Cu(I)/Ag(I) efflux system membrane fusion protein
MQLVRIDQHTEPREAPEQVQRQLNHITEHYLALQRLLASDNTDEIAKHALGIASAGEELLKSLSRAELSHENQIRKAVEQIRSSALKINGNQITDDRVHFVDLSSSLVSLLEHLRPDRDRWPHLYVFHCPMSKGDWIQTVREIRNPYYGFQMLKCGELQATK